MYNNNGINIITYRPDFLKEFIRLNREWIERYFNVEESDLKVFNHAEEEIIGRGGQIFFAQHPDGEIVGCCALINHPGKGCCELAKMAVSPHWQGKGIGSLLGKTALQYAAAHGFKEIFLEGNTKLAASILLYRKLGFKESGNEKGIYERCNIIMKRKL